MIYYALRKHGQLNSKKFHRKAPPQLPPLRHEVNKSEIQSCSIYHGSDYIEYFRQSDEDASAPAKDRDQKRTLAKGLPKTASEDRGGPWADFRHLRVMGFTSTCY